MIIISEGTQDARLSVLVQRHTPTEVAFQPTTKEIKALECIRNRKVCVQSRNRGANVAGVSLTTTSRVLLPVSINHFKNACMS